MKYYKSFSLVWLINIMVSPVAVAHTLVNAKPSSSAAPPIEPQIDSSASMVDDLVENIRKSGDHVDCRKELAALIDIATFKDIQAHSASYRAEQQLLSLYAHPKTSSVTRRDMVKQLLRAENILARGTGRNAAAFGMPASLLHLAAQHARNQMRNDEPDITIAPAHLEEIGATLKDATGLSDETDIVDINREVTTDEMLASFATLPGACPHVINLSKDVCDKPAQMQQLLDKVPDEGPAIAPLLVDGHFMLIAAEKTAVNDKYAFTIGNTRLRISGAVKRLLPSGRRLNSALLLRVKNKLKERFTGAFVKQTSSAFKGKIGAMEVCSNHLQAHAINSCGPLVSLMADNLALHRNKDIRIAAQIQDLSDNWRAMDGPQQVNAVIAQRARMIGNTVVWRTESRFVDCGPTHR
jgi:hypothetical protein